MIEKMAEVKICGTGIGVPERVVSNDEIAGLVETNDDWIVSRTGIRERRIVISETLEELCTTAGQQAVDAAGIDAEALDMIIVATLTPDQPLPNVSSLVQRNIGAVNATCFDINAACSGFLFALNTGCMYIKAEAARYVLVIGGEVLSKIIDWEDRSTCILFGDGAGAAILSTSKEKGFIGAITGSDGSAGMALTCGERPIENPFIAAGKEYISRYVYMEGNEIFKFAVSQVPKCIRQLLEQNQTTVEEIDCFVLHQANKRIIDAVSRRLKIPEEKFIINIDRYGNTSAASIPLVLDELYKSGRYQKGQKIVIAGFGGGLTWGASLFQI